MTGKVKLLVNETPIQLEEFVSGFIEHTVSGMVASLKGTPEAGHISLDIQADEVTLYLTGSVVAITDFVKRIFRSTVFGIVAPLKGVGAMDRVIINIDK